MNGERWELLKDLLYQAMQLTAGERGAFLDQACSSDVSLRAELESLLNAEENVRTSFMQRSPFPQDATTVTGWLVDWRKGSQEAGDRLFAASYQELRRLAARHFRKESPGHTLQPTALVHELYVKLFAGEPVKWQNRAHFFAVVAQQLRRLLIEYARARLTEKRGGGQVRLSLTDVGGLAANREEDLIDLDEALHRLEELDPRSARVVELRFFGGLTEQEAAEAIGISVATLKRDWDFARAWLLSQLSER